jgi:hypothetical protein
MPVVIPATLPTWATAPVPGVTAIEVPSAGKQAAGFAAGEMPPAEFHNWLFNLLCAWALYTGYYLANWWEQYAGDALHSGSWDLVGVDDAHYAAWNSNGSSGRLTKNLPVKRGRLVKQIKVYCTVASGTGADISALLVKHNVTIGAAAPTVTTDIVAEVFGTNTTNMQVIVLTPAGAGYEMLEYDVLTLVIRSNTGATNQHVYLVEVNYASP